MVIRKNNIRHSFVIALHRVYNKGELPMKTIYEEYAEHICTNCKAEECTKGIAVCKL